MIRSRVLATAIVALLTGMVSTVFALDLAEWKYRANATIEDGAGEYCALTLTPKIYDAAKLDLGDIRLVDARGEQVPYVLAKPKDITDRQTYDPAIINRSTNGDRAAIVTLDFGKKVLKNCIEAATQGDNFRRAVRIEGSNDNVEFFTVVDRAYVFAISPDRRFGEIDLPTNDYRYLRITVWPMPEEEKSPAIETISAFRIERTLAERQPVEMLRIEHSEDVESNSSIHVYDLAYRRLPVSEIEIDVADDVFYRYVTVEGRDAATRKVKVDSEDNRQRFREVEVGWKRIISDTIYRYVRPDGQKHEKLVLRVPSHGAVYKYLKIAIKNYDDKPVTVESASARMIAHKIVFEAQDNVAPTLYVGSESARVPQYDLQRTLTNPLQVKTRIATLSRISDNPLFGEAEEKPVAWTEKHKVLLLIIMVGVALVLCVFILKSFKSIQGESERQDGP